MEFSSSNPVEPNQAKGEAPTGFMSTLVADDFRRLGLPYNETRLTVIRQAATASAKKLAVEHIKHPSSFTESQLTQIATSTYRLMDPRQREEVKDRVYVGRILPGALRWAGRTSFLPGNHAVSQVDGLYEDDGVDRPPVWQMQSLVDVPETGMQLNVPWQTTLNADDLLSPGMRRRIRLRQVLHRPAVLVALMFALVLATVQGWLWLVQNEKWQSVLARNLVPRSATTNESPTPVFPTSISAPPKNKEDAEFESAIDSSEAGVDLIPDLWGRTELVEVDWEMQAMEHDLSIEYTDETSGVSSPAAEPDTHQATALNVSTPDYPVGWVGRIYETDQDLGVGVTYQSGIASTAIGLSQIEANLGRGVFEWTIELSGEFSLDSSALLRVRCLNTHGVQQTLWIDQQIITITSPSMVLPVERGEHTIRWQLSGAEIPRLGIEIRNVKSGEMIPIRSIDESTIGLMPAVWHVDFGSQN